MIQRLRAWSYLRQRLGHAAADPAKALHGVVAVYSSHPTAPLSLLARSQSLPAERFHEMESRREVVRIRAMRGTSFVVPTATAPRVFAATRAPMSALAPRLRYAGLDLEGYARLKERVIEVAREPITANGLRRALDADDRLMAGVRLLTNEGLLLRLGTSLRADNLRYVATEAWLGHPLEELDREEALAWLAREYLRGYGPARVEDFAWWAGVPKGRVRTAISGVDVVAIGEGLLLHRDEQYAFESVEPLDPEALDILPKWDAYTMGHAPDGRQRLVNDEHLRSAYSAGGDGTLAGDGLPLVLVGGRAVASWSHRFERDRMLVRITPFQPDTLGSVPYERAFDDVGRLLGAAAVEVREASSQ